MHLWQKLQPHILQALGDEDYIIWISELHPIDSDEDSISITSNNVIVLDWVRDHLLNDIETIARHHFGSNFRIHLAPPGENRSELEGEAKPFSLISHPINPSFTFDRFVTGPSNHFACAASKSIADRPGADKNPLYIFGGAGLGKTHLLHAIAHRLVNTMPNVRFLYITTEQFVNILINSIREKSVDLFSQHIRSVDLLLMDDVQFICGKERTQEEFFHTFDSLHSDSRQVVFTADCYPTAMPGLDERLRSRFVQGLVAEIRPPDLEMRCAILQDKSRAQGWKLDDDVALYIAQRFRKNVRELEGCLNRSIVFAQLNNSSSLTFEVVRGALTELLPEERTTTPSDIIRFVAQHYGVRVSDIKGRSFKRKIDIPRNVAMHLIRSIFGLSYPEIGKIFSKHHSSVIYALDKIDKIRKTNPDFDATIVSFENHFEAAEVSLSVAEPTIPDVQVDSSSESVDYLQIREIVELLGMSRTREVAVTEYGKGVVGFPALLPIPEPLRGNPIAVICVSSNSEQNSDLALLRDTVKTALTDIRHRFELPFLLFCDNIDVASAIIPAQNTALVLDEDTIDLLRRSTSPSQTFTGLLLTKGLLAISPYGTNGAVMTPEMFYGRDDLLRELLVSSKIRFILVGPRRVGKTSLLQRLFSQTSNYTERDYFFLDFLGVKGVQEAANRLETRLLVSSRGSDSQVNGAQRFTEILEHQVRESSRPCVLLIDEADGLIESDASNGFPLLSRLRSLQAEGICSFVLAGYWHLYRRALEYESPLFNFAEVRIIGPLEREAAIKLAREPMTRVGIEFNDPGSPERIADFTGGYAHLIQFLCHQLIEELKADDEMLLTDEHIDRAKKSRKVKDYLVLSFQHSTSQVCQILSYEAAENSSFSLADGQELIEGALRREVPFSIMEDIMRQLILSGYFIESDDVYSWTIPLLRRTLLERKNRKHLIERLIKELPDDPNEWVSTVWMPRQSW